MNEKEGYHVLLKSKIIYELDELSAIFTTKQEGKTCWEDAPFLQKNFTNNPQIHNEAIQLKDIQSWFQSNSISYTDES